MILCLEMKFNGNNYCSIINDPCSLNFNSYSSKNTISKITEEEQPFKTNVYTSGDFDEYALDGTLNDFDGSGSIKRTIRNVTYTGNSANGIYSGLLEAEGATTYGGTVSIYYQFSEYPRVVENVSLSMWINIDQPDIKTGGYSHISLEMNNGTFYYLYYVISLSPTGYYPTSGWNSTNYQYLLINQTHGEWTHFYRNITHDVENVFGYASPNLELKNFDIETYSPHHPSGISRIIIDDVSITNNTDEFIDNGDFESGDGVNWSDTYVNSIGDITLTDKDIIQGSRALNMTVYRLPETTSTGMIQIYDSISYPQGYYLTDDQSLIIEFDYKYSDTYNGGGQYAYYRLRFKNNTNYIDWYIYLGSDRDENDQTNNTIDSDFSFITNSSSFGIRDSWQHLSINPDKLFKEWNIYNVSLSYISFYAYTGTNDNSSIQLLVDNFKIITYPTGDPGFEQAWYPISLYNPLTGWYRSTGQYPNISLTTESHNNNFALNLTANNQDQGVYRNLKLKINPGTFTSFWWKISEITPNSGAFFHMVINNSFEIYYVIATNGMTYSNSTFSFYFIHENATKIGTWYNLVRNILNDTIEVFPFLASTNLLITFLEIRADITNQGKIAIFFDDVHFLQDTHGPNFHSVERIIPDSYYNPIEIKINVTDEISGIDLIQIYYTNDSSTWYSTKGIYSNGFYHGFIPVMIFNTNVDYYIVSVDRSKNLATWPYEGGYESFTTSFLGPELSEVFLNPTTPQYDESVQVTVGVNDYDILENVTLFFKIDDGNWQNILMTTDTGSIFSSTIPASNWGTEVFYFITAFAERKYTSSIGNMTHPLSYIIEDEIDPIMNVIGPTSPNLSGIINFSISASDEGSGINKVEIIVDEEYITSLNVFPNTFSWNTEELSNSEHTITFLAWDNAENVVEIGLNYTVYNPKGLDAIGVELESILTHYGFIMGSFSMIGLYVIIKIIRWKRSR